MINKRIFKLKKNNINDQINIKKNSKESKENGTNNKKNLNKNKTNKINNFEKIDFDPSRCKDFHDSGYCGWGNTCIYAHDRTNYMNGYELEKSWKNKQKEKLKIKLDILNKTKEIKNDENICKLCDSTFIYPMRTECKHKFCEKCILNYFKLNKNKCFCGKQTNGILIN